MDLGLAGLTYLVTGATRGIGYGVAQTLLAEGANVVISGRHPAGVEDAVARLGSGAARARVVGAARDNADPDTAAVLVQRALESFGALDGLCVSVGGPSAGSVLDASDQDWQRAFDSVFLGALRLARTAVPHLGAGGSIAFVLSSSVRSPIPGLAISNGLRPGLAMVAKSLADEVGPHGVRVNSLLPGRIRTDRLAELDSASGNLEQTRAAHAERIPLRRDGEVEEFARVAAFVLSPAASYLTGSVIPIDGGALRSL